MAGLIRRRRTEDAPMPIANSMSVYRQKANQEYNRVDPRRLERQNNHGEIR